MSGRRMCSSNTLCPPHTHVCRQPSSAIPVQTVSASCSPHLTSQVSGRQKKKKNYIFSSQPRADQMLGLPREGQLMCTQETSLHSASIPASMH